MSFRTVDKALLAFTVAVVALSTVSYYLFQSADPYKCQALLRDGFWLNPTNLINWQPAGCMLHQYRVTESTTCLRNRRAVFIGGNTTRHLFEGVAKKLDDKYELSRLSRQAHDSITIQDTRLEFVWDPPLQSPDLEHIRKGFENENSRPALTVIGLGHDYIRTESDLTLWAAQIGALYQGFAGTAAERARRSDKLVIAPVLDPNVTALSGTDQRMLSPERIDNINDILLRLSDQYGVDTAFAYKKLVHVPGALDDGLNPTDKIRTVMADILLNLKCNEQLPKHYPYASTCCNSYPWPSWVQLTFIVFVTAFVPTAVYLVHRGYTVDSSRFLAMMPASKYHYSILVMGLTVVLSYYCDRTNIFEKEQKQTEPSQFFIGMGLIILASLYTLKTSDKDLPFLNRDQTDEWKGWMQVAILVYHYVGVSKTQYIYDYMRVCPTSYLFMTGFGHTVYFLKKDDFSFKRVVATMLRLNLLNVILAYVMGNDWLLYYFAPLVTWNFFVIFFLLWAGHQHNKNLTFLYGKMFGAAIINMLFYRIPGVLEIAWRILQITLRMQGDLREWRFRITLDQYSIFPGMICAVLFINWNKMDWPKSARWDSITKLIYAVSLAIMLWYAYFEVSQPSKVVYNQKHTYVCWLPCCAFVILRNSTQWLRNTHNGFFAWVGRGSLETFLLQFHIWLGADTAGLLTIPGLAHQRFLNFLIMTPIFFWVSSLTTTATQDVINWIMGAEPRPSLPTTNSTKAMPQAQPPVDEKSANGNAKIDSSLPVNGQPIDIKPADPEKQEKEKDVSYLEPKAEPSRVRTIITSASKDLRVRVAIILGAMAFMNWTFYL